MKSSLSRRFIEKMSAHPELQHGAVRVGMLLVAAAEQQKGTFPVEANLPTSFIAGFKLNGLSVPGVSFRPQTVHKSIQALTEAGLLSIDEGSSISGGRQTKLFTLHLD